MIDPLAPALRGEGWGEGDLIFLERSEIHKPPLTLIVQRNDFL